MRCTGIRFECGTKPTANDLKYLCDIIKQRAQGRGFITDTEQLTGSAIKIGLHMSSFRIDTNMLQHNARIGRFYDKSPKGYKRTDVPTWDQRVEFNDMVNDVFDKYGYVALIKSGCFTIRDKKRGRHDEQDWENQTPSWMGYKGATVNGFGEELCRIVTEREAREELNSDEREKEHAEATRGERLARARDYRKRVKTFENAPKVIVSGFYGEKTKNGKLLTHAAFAKLLSKLNRWELRRVKAASVAATVAAQSSESEAA